MSVYLVGAGPGDPGLITRKGAEVLSDADIVIFDRLVDPAVLSLAKEDAQLIDLGHELVASELRGHVRQERINQLLVSHARAGRSVVRLKGGDPFLFGRGGEEVEALQAAGVDCEVIPGVSSAFGVPALSGIPVTHRGLSTSVTVVTGHASALSDEGGRGDSTGLNWRALARGGDTLVILMGMGSRAEIARSLITGGRAGDTPVAVTQWGSTPMQQTVHTTLEQLADVTLGSPAIIIIGAVAALDLDWMGRRPLGGLVTVLTRPTDRTSLLRTRLESAGSRVVELPLTVIAEAADGGNALRAAAQRLATDGAAAYAWVAFTSVNAVNRFLAEVPDHRVLAGVRLAAVGPATAAALAGHHLVADLVPSRATATDLAAAFPDADSDPGAVASPDAIAGTVVLFPKATKARPDLPKGLRAKGWEVDEVDAYQTLMVDPPPQRLTEQLSQADVIIFASPSAVEAFVTLRDDAGQSLVVPPLVACVGPVTSAAAHQVGLEVQIEVHGSSPNDLVGALVAHRLASRTGTNS